MAKKSIDPEFKDVYRINLLKVLLVLLIMGVVGYGIYYIYDKKLYEKVINYFELKEEDDEEETHDDFLKTIYYYKNGDSIKIMDTKSNELELMSSYQCKTNNCNYNKDVINKKYNLVIDDKSYIYNIDDKNEILLNIQLKASANFKLIYSENKLYGILYKDEKLNYYSVDANKVVYTSSTWDYYDDSNFAKYGYIALKTSSTSGLLDVNTYKVSDDTIYEGVYSYYDDMPVIKKGDMYYLLDKKLKPMNPNPKYIRYLNAKDYLYLMDGTKNYYKCNVENGTCSKKSATYAFYDLLNDNFIILYGTNMYFGKNTYTPTKKIQSIKNQNYDISHSFYLEEKKGDKEPGYYLAFIKDGETKKYELYYFDMDLKFVSQESIDI